MVLVKIDYPEKGCSTPCPAMRCQKCIISESKNVLDFLKKDREKNRPDWCPILAPINFGEERIPPDPIQNCGKSEDIINGINEAFTNKAAIIQGMYNFVTNPNLRGERNKEND